MSYKKMKQNLGFADFALASSMKVNRSLKNMEKLDKAIDWSRIEAILMNHYTIGTSGESAVAYRDLCTTPKKSIFRSIFPKMRCFTSIKFLPKMCLK